MDTEKLMSRYRDYEKYEEYEYFDNGRDNRRKQKRLKSKDQLRHEIVTAAVEEDDSPESFVPSYVAPLDPRHYERQWVIDSVSPFYRDNVISDVTRLVKGGKEANVYCCTANPATGLELIAAKLYRPRVLRHLKNDSVYKEGRTLRDSEGKEIRGSREDRAMRKKTRFGQYLDTMAWIEHEFQIQQQLHKAGADVPRPVAHGGNTILMAYLGDEWSPAPTLNDVSLEPEEAGRLLARTMRNVELMLRLHYVHGDLSAYNILYWEEHMAIIDFPQVVDARTNPNAFKLLERDIRRVCQYFGRFGAKAEPVDLAAGLWEQYMRAEL